MFIFSLKLALAQISKLSGPDEGRAVADRAMHVLRQAVAAGYDNAAQIDEESDLDPLRSRPDFQILMMDLAFPADPFARGN